MLDWRIRKGGVTDGQESIQPGSNHQDSSRWYTYMLREILSIVKYRQMNHWAVDDNYIQSERELVIESGLRVSISPRDHIVLFKRDNEQIRFHSQVTSLDRHLSGSNEKGFHFSAHLSQLEPIDNALNLDELTYSLLKIYRYGKPYRHFLRPYVSLSPADYYTITTASIYWARTAFGLYINALRREQLNRFMQDIALTTPETLIQISNFYSAWISLRTFINEEYIAAAELLQLLHVQVDRLQSREDLGLDYFKLGVSSDDSNVTDLLNDQGKLLSKFVEITHRDGADVLLE
ncbi:hypothetical protein ACFLVS_04105, partial [Chloroflexota bacterium]